jgi:hypothetical protein
MELWSYGDKASGLCLPSCPSWIPRRLQNDCRRELLRAKDTDEKTEAGVSSTY